MRIDLIILSIITFSMALFINWTAFSAKSAPVKAIYYVGAVVSYIVALALLMSFLEHL